jgi:hypothetical protein
MAVNFDAPAMAVRILFEGDYFWLDPGRSRTIRIYLPQGVELEMNHHL